MPGTRGTRKGRVKSGLETLIEKHPMDLRGRRVGLLAHSASVTADLRYAWEALAALPGISLKALFSPEHGLLGTHQDMEGVAAEQRGPLPGIPVHSLYGNEEGSLKPTAAMLGGIDLLVADLQDVGSRYYTYLYSIAACMDACREAGVEVWVLDRPNPLGGVEIEGGLLSPEYASFVGRVPIPVRHGMTIGECARLINEVFQARCRLRVLPMDGWRRRMWFDHTGLPWVMPSPNMPTLDTALVYPGGCLIEGTNLSEGRGTTRPFEIVGAPWIDPAALARSLRELDLPGVEFRPLFFRPTFHKYAGQSCGGVQLHVLDRNRFRPFLTGVELIRAARRLWPAEFDWRREPYEFETRRLAIDLLAGGTWLREAVEGGKDLRECRSEWRRQLPGFKALRSDYLLYP